MGLARGTPRGTYYGSCPVRGCGYGTPSMGADKSRACPARAPPATHTVPDPVWGTPGVSGYDAPFVRNGYKWTARTTTLHPDGQCKHRPPRGETPRARTYACAPPPPPTSNSTNHPPDQKAGGRGPRDEGGESAHVPGEGLQDGRDVMHRVVLRACGHKHPRCRACQSRVRGRACGTPSLYSPPCYP